MATPLLEIILRARGVVSQITTVRGREFGYPIEIRRDVEPVILAMAGKTIGKPYPVEIEYSDVPVTSIRGQLIRREANATIIVSKQQSRCWKRFVICKELAHLLIDDDDDTRTTDMESHIQGLTSDAKQFNFDDALGSEYDAIILAAEILVPWIDRENLKSMLAAGKTPNEIAHFYKVPEKIIDMIKGGYLASSAKMNLLVDSQKRMDSMS